MTCILAVELNTSLSWPCVQEATCRPYILYVGNSAASPAPRVDTQCGDDPRHVKLWKGESNFVDRCFLIFLQDLTTSD